MGRESKMSDSPERVERWWDGTLGGKGVLVGGW